MRAIQRHLPNPRHVEIHRITVAAPPAVAWEAARHFDGGRIPWVRLLFDVRELPARLLGRRPDDHDRRIGVDQIADHDRGFRVLEERPGEEVVIGAVGQFWHLSIPFAEVPAAGFASFVAPGWGKVAWAIRVEPFGAGSGVTFELRTSATDEDSWRRLSRYFRAIGPMSKLIRASVMAHLEEALGSLPRPRDPSRPLPGDDIVPDALHTLSHGIDIEAPPTLVWRWLMQLGCDRGGWYSIDALDHGGVPSTDHLVEAWTDREVGQRVAAVPGDPGGYKVLVVQPPHAFVIGGEADRLGGHLTMSWAFVVEPLGHDATHLVTRVRGRVRPRWSDFLQDALIYPWIHAVMQHAQLAHLERLAGRDALARTDGAIAP